MKHVKKLASLLLALVMVCALATTAFAAGETGSITVDNPVADTTYTAYKIFDVTYNSDQSAYSYTIDSTSHWFGTVQTYADEAGSGLTLTQVNGSTTYNVSTTADFSAPKFADALKADVAGKTGGIVLTAQADGTVSATGLDLGYYFVTSTSGALCNLTTTDPDATIHDKNDVPFEKEGDKGSADIGETVNYTITGKVPDYTGFKTYTYEITDTMSEGLTFNKDVKVTIGGTDVTSACTVTYDVGGNANKFTVSIPVKNYTIGAEIKVTYSAVVNEKAIAKIETNKAELKYSNNPTNSTSTTTTPSDTKVYSSKIVIDKYEDGSADKKLAGAEFVLYKEVTTGEGVEAVTTKLYYKWNDTAKKVEWVENKADATVKTTDNNGAASFDGIANGTYYLEEIEAPAGYNQLKEPVKVTVSGGDTVAELTVTQPVANSTGTELPSTGGMGTTLFYTLGAILVLGAGVLLVTKKRMSEKA